MFIFVEFIMSFKLQMSAKISRLSIIAMKFYFNVDILKAKIKFILIAIQEMDFGLTLNKSQIKRY